MQQGWLQAACGILYAIRVDRITRSTLKLNLWYVKVTSIIRTTVA